MFGTCNFILALWTTLQSSWSTLSTHLASVPEAQADISNNFKSSWSVCMIKCLGAGNGHSNSTVRTTARPLLSVIVSLCSTLLSTRDQYPIELQNPLSCWLNNLHSTLEPYVFVSTVYWCVPSRSAIND